MRRATLWLHEQRPTRREWGESEAQHPPPVGSGRDDRGGKNPPLEKMPRTPGPHLRGLNGSRRASTDLWPAAPSVERRWPTREPPPYPQPALAPRWSGGGPRQ